MFNMGFKKEKRDKIIADIVKRVDNHPNDIVKIIIDEHNVSRQTVNNYMKNLIKENIIELDGSKRSPIYRLKEHKKSFIFDINSDTSEDKIWSQEVIPFLPELRNNIKSICEYGFTEMFNNVIDHSESDTAIVSIKYTAQWISMMIIDKGIGIFNKIQEHFNLSDPKQSILELSKGKLTSDPDRHSGEGIFFSSRMFDEFRILSQGLFFTSKHDSDWIMDYNGKPENTGTCVEMKISLNSNRNISEVFNQYSNDNFGFSKTIVPVKLLQYEGMELVSRSQAKRLITRFDRFEEVILNFDGISIIGQSFADELFRIFKNNYPNVHIQYINANENVEGMIKHVCNTK